MKNLENEMDIIFLLDKSGSMYGSEKDTIGGFNSIIKEQKSDEVQAKVTTILFDHEYEMLYKRKDLFDVDELTEKEYQVRGSTALLDAIGRTIITMQKEISGKVLFVITTDGRENSSVEFTKTQIKNLITNSNWEFLYLGADIDSYGEAAGIGINQERVANYRKTADGINEMYNSVSKATTMLYEKNEIDLSWKEDLEE
ncbi:vWA domain-containing protein [Methanobrevibacter sp.]|uniref:vWA domain-containing protein n=1 Tax=Methanobrevibacter sp. TaxID=66852 RepID=UPI002E7721B1|nr:vWA domain-containing protein [Methanobrevibacter sp.]MEE0025918.1 vWA domain-containing protein [Methanobrevibacter sp.]